MSAPPDSKNSERDSHAKNRGPLFSHPALGAADFSANAHRALGDAQLQHALHNSRDGFILKRAKAVARLPEFEALRDAARDIKAHTLEYLDLYLEAYEEKVLASGGMVHYAATAEAANSIVLDICRKHGAKSVAKGKSMIGEEMGLNAALEAVGITPVETDLGEYIISFATKCRRISSRRRCI